jgi:hypothetical protein
MPALTLTERIDLRLRKLWVKLAARSKRTKPREVRGVLLGEDPCAFAVWDYVFAKTSKGRPDFWERWRDKPLLVVIMRTWDTGTVAQLEPWVRLLTEHKRNFPLHRVVFAANTKVEVVLCKAARIEVVWCNHNALVNERIFQPPAGAISGDAREFDAIYDAQIARYKRHHLATEVKRLGLIHYTTPRLFETLWTLKIRWLLRGARILNRQHRGIWPIRMVHEEVAAHYNRARVGLCLSAVEGAMLASIQYLLCGLPVVTTPNRGGRNDFFDAENSIEVAAEPEAVAAGVRTLIERRVDPWSIREKTLARMALHRARLVTLVERFQRENGVPEERLLSKMEPPGMRNGFSDKLG